LIAVLDKKSLAIRKGDSVTAIELRNETVSHYLDGQNALSKLKQDYPELYETVVRIKRDKERFLTSESLTTTSLPPGHLLSTRESIEQELSSTLRGLDKFTVRTLAFEAIADWLLRCPLNFPGHQNEIIASQH
jgi:hypothetical protein